MTNVPPRQGAPGSKGPRGERGEAGPAVSTRHPSFTFLINRNAQGQKRKSMRASLSFLSRTLQLSEDCLNYKSFQASNIWFHLVNECFCLFSLIWRGWFGPIPAAAAFLVSRWSFPHIATVAYLNQDKRDQQQTPAVLKYSLSDLLSVSHRDRSAHGVISDHLGPWVFPALKDPAGFQFQERL